MSKNQLTPEEIYKRNQKIAKALKVVAPICFWGFLALAILCLVFALKNSFGNIIEICNLLENGKFTGEELSQNYAYLLEKYGEWRIGNGGAGFLVNFINIGNALFSGLMITNCILAVVFFVSAFVLGKWLFPKIAEQILIDNQDMVNMVVLKNHNKE